jgi:NADH-quinone oxidoreductase subunit J
MLSVNETGYALPFEVISMLLLAALVGCIVIALRENKDPKEISHEEH